MDSSTPAFLQGIFAFTGSGLETPVTLEGASYQVPYDKRSQLIYFRAGNSTDELITVILLYDGKPLRYFPVGAKSSLHVPLAVVDDLAPESRIELQIVAPEDTSGAVVVDIGFVEII